MQHYLTWILGYLWASSNLTTPETCTLLDKKLPGRVSFPSSEEYIVQQSSYAFYASSAPACVVSPVSSLEVSIVISVARDYDCPFAVKSGGSSHSGGSIVGSDGFVIDLKHLDEVSLSDDRTRVFVGPGALWIKVYEELASVNLTTTGGRASSVGVGGFLLGGGITPLSYKHGFANENILSYEVVLANGTVVTANAHHHSDLLEALRLGSTNYGVVTRFELPTFPITPLFAGLQVHDATNAHAILSNFPSFVHAADKSRESAAIFTIALASSMKQTMVITLQAYYGWSLPELASSFPSNAYTPLVDTTAEKSLLDYVQETSGSGLVKKGRTIWTTLSYIADETDTEFAWDIFVQGQSVFTAHEERDGFAWTLSVQPLTSRMHASSDDNLILVLLMVDWQNVEDEMDIVQTVREWASWTEEQAKRRELFHPFLFMNYAGSSQDVYGRSVDKDTLGRLLKAQDVYDSDRTLSRLLRGGFKLTSPQSRTEGTLTIEL
ncbi:FAD-binding domain-containing protein [Hymenopellis radicata]|nr:FAD-binding domain-containing protein [Hymenopellis radicata]